MKNLNERKKALADYLGESNIKHDTDFDAFVLPNGRTYKVFTGAEADEAAGQEILNSLWAFKASFILDHSRAGDDMDARERDEAMNALEKMQATLCESANPLVRCLIADMDEFIDDAIRADGRGHFIAQYDGDEIELGGGLYAYRID